MKPNSFAIFDALYIINQTKKQCSGLSVTELNFLSYFACLLSLYNGHPVTEWGYIFLRNELGAPISADLYESCQILEKNGELQKQETVLNITERGIKRIGFYSGLAVYHQRIQFLEAACDCLLIESILDIISAISKDAVITESSVHALKYLNNSDNNALTILYKQFDIIKRAIGKRNNLFIPATSWLFYLRQGQEKKV